MMDSQAYGGDTASTFVSMFPQSSVTVNVAVGGVPVQGGPPVPQSHVLAVVQELLVAGVGPTAFAPLNVHEQVYGCAPPVVVEENVTTWLAAAPFVCVKSAASGMWFEFATNVWFDRQFVKSFWIWNCTPIEQSVFATMWIVRVWVLVDRSSVALTIVAVPPTTF